MKRREGREGPVLAKKRMIHIIILEQSIIEAHEISILAVIA